ncbi:hypothetical protein L2E82_53066 [Cichorium intybus]|nr:hypothetical protein L2E82_53066 [Cichorium intybus]
MALGATCVQKLDGSRDSAIHTKYRILLRSSSMREPRYPLPRVRFDNDPSAGSPTETLLRLLLPLNDKVQWNSRDVAGRRTAHVAAILTLHRTIQSACFEHSNFFKVTAPEARPGQLKARSASPTEGTE